MSNGKSKVTNVKTAPAPYKVEAAKTASAPPPTQRPPLFRPTDWLAFFATTLLVFAGYYLTLAPDLTLEDSGELAVGSFYAGIPHPPGYPVWAIYTWLFSHLVPISNIAYRVALASALAGAVSCGMLAMMVSRGSSMMMEGIAELKAIERRWENAICLVSGFVSGMLIGFNGFMWSQSVIVEVYSFSMVSMVGMLLCFLRWVYAPDQRRYLYMALFLFGICVTNHQTLLLAAIGLEVMIIAGQPKLGRDFLLGNSICYVVGLIAKQQGILTGMNDNAPIFFIYNCVGVLSIAGCGWLAVTTKEIAKEWKPVLICGACWLVGAAFYLWMPLAGMSNPPMQWGYPRTVEGFFHALSRGQYEKTHPTDIAGSPFHFIHQIGIMFGGVVDEFNWVYSLLALVPFFFFLRMQRRERAWMTGLFGIYCCMGFFLLILLNPGDDRTSIEVGRVQFTASHYIVSIFVGYGITLIAASLAANYARFRFWALCGGAVTVLFGLYSLVENQHSSPGQLLTSISRAFAKDQYGLPVIASLLVLGLAAAFTLVVASGRTKAAMPLILLIFAAMPASTIMSNWFDNEQRGHLFGFWFGHDMFTPPFNGKDGKPLYPEMTRDAVLYGGTDPGRFCPTYMIFDESFIPAEKKRDPKFDRRDVYIITQNALADGTYLMYIRAHYNRSKQYQYDTPFFQQLARSGKEKELNYQTNAVARALIPLDRFFIGLGDSIEQSRRAGSSLFKPADFTDLPSLIAKLQKHDAADPLSSWLFDNLSQPTQQLLASHPGDAATRAELAKDLNTLLERELLDKKRLKQLHDGLDSLIPESSPKDQARKKAIDAEIAEISKDGPLYTPERFKNVTLPDTLAKFVAQDPQYHTRIRLNRLLLEAAYPKEIAKSVGGVYPDREIYIASPEDSQRCFQEYMADAQRRLQIGQLKPGEDVKVMDGRVQVSGQVAVMAINGLLTKVMFEANPGHEFYVEESFPLDWMYPYLTPFGVIMKINRQQLPELDDDILRRDHEFWSQYSARLIGNWITYDTPVKEICEWAERVYTTPDHTHLSDFSKFTGDRAFVRDDQGQKAFSKLRSSIGGIYAWRINNSKSQPEQQRMIKEADFTFKQAFAFCPYSPEAVFRYVQLLVGLQRFDDALQIALTCQKLDPFNSSITGLVKNLTDAKASQNPPRPILTGKDGGHLRRPPRRFSERPQSRRRLPAIPADQPRHRNS